MAFITLQLLHFYCCPFLKFRYEIIIIILLLLLLLLLLTSRFMFLKIYHVETKELTSSDFCDFLARVSESFRKLVFAGRLHLWCFCIYFPILILMKDPFELLKKNQTLDFASWHDLMPYFFNYNNNTLMIWNNLEPVRNFGYLSSSEGSGLFGCVEMNAFVMFQSSQVDGASGACSLYLSRLCCRGDSAQGVGRWFQDFGRSNGKDKKLFVSIALQNTRTFSTSWTRLVFKLLYILFQSERGKF